MTDHHDSITGGSGEPPAPDWDDPGPLMTPGEVAALLRVHPKTVTRWAKTGKLISFRTLGNHRRYRVAEVRALLDAKEARS
jgi:excisionase family DNA binding protein